MSIEGVTPVDQEVQPKFPKIVYTEAVLHKDCPYEIQVDPESAGFLLRLAGVPETDIEGVTIIVDRKSKHRTPFRPELGTYNPEDQSITLYGDYFWELQQRIIKRAENILKKRGRTDPVKVQGLIQTTQKRFPDTSIQSNKFHELSSGQRLSWYVNVVPHDRAKAMVEKLAKMHAQREISLTLQHESKHAADLGKSKHPALRKNLPKILVVGANVLSIIGWNAFVGFMSFSPLAELTFKLYGDITLAFLGNLLVYVNDPLETSARNFEKLLEHDPRQHFVTIQRK